jgi:hypothetical protein
MSQGEVARLKGGERKRKSIQRKTAGRAWREISRKSGGSSTPGGAIICGSYVLMPQYCPRSVPWLVGRDGYTYQNGYEAFDGNRDDAEGILDDVEDCTIVSSLERLTRGRAHLPGEV